MAFNNSNIAKFLVLFLFVGFLLGVGFALKSCTEFATLVDPNYEYNEYNESAPPLSDTCYFGFNYDGWNNVNGYRLEWASNVDFTFNLIDNSKLIVGFEKVSNFLGGEGENPIGYEVKVLDSKENITLEKRGVIDLAIKNQFVHIKDKQNKQIISFKVTDSIKEDLFYIFMTPNIKGGVSNCSPTTTFNKVDDSCIMIVKPEKIILQQIMPITIISSPFTTSVLAKQNANTLNITQITKSSDTTGYCINGEYILEKNNQNEVITAKNETCPTDAVEVKIKENTCEDVPLIGSYKCYSAQGDFVKNNSLIFEDGGQYSTSGKQYLNREVISCGAKGTNLLYSYKVIDKRVYICEILKTKIKTVKSGYKCEDLEDGSYSFDSNPKELKIGVENETDEWSVINTNNVNSVFVDEGQGYYYKKTKDTWQKCVKGEGTTTSKTGTTKKTVKKGTAGEKLKKDYSDFCKKNPKSFLCEE